MDTLKPQWGLEQLKEWAKPALEYPELIAIARTSSSARQAKNRALEFAASSGLGEDIAKAARWLMIIRRDYGENYLEEYLSKEKTMTTQTAQPSRTKRFREHLEFAQEEMPKEIQRLTLLAKDPAISASELKETQRKLEEAKTELEKLEKTASLNFDPDFITELLESPELPMGSFRQFFGFGLREFKFKPKAKNPNTNIELEINPWERTLTLTVEIHDGEYETYNHAGEKKTEKQMDKFYLSGRVVSMLCNTRQPKEPSVIFHFEEENLRYLTIYPRIMVWSGKDSIGNTSASVTFHLVSNRKQSTPEKDHSDIYYE